MNRKNILSLLVMTLTTIVSLFFIMYVSNDSSTLLSFIPILISSISITIFYKYDDYKDQKYSIIYEIIMICFGIFDILFISFLLFGSFGGGASVTDQFGNTSHFVPDFFECINLFSSILYFILMFTVLIFCFLDLDKKTENTNFYLIIISSLLIIFVHARYFFDSNLHADKASDTWYKGSSLFIEQNYVYFVILYLITIIHKFIMKRIK